MRGRFDSEEDRQAYAQLPLIREWLSGNSDSLQAVRTETSQFFLNALSTSIRNFISTVETDWSYDSQVYAELMGQLEYLDEILVKNGYLEKLQE